MKKSKKKLATRLQERQRYLDLVNDPDRPSPIVDVDPMLQGETCGLCGREFDGRYGKRGPGRPAGVDGAPNRVPATPDKGWVQTASGGRFYFREMDRSSITLEDIAAQLSKLCRYTGACRKYYSVAEHSYYVSLIVPEEHALHAILHDASEAYLGDVSTPLKGMLDAYREIEAAVSERIYRRFRLPADYHPCVKAADYRLLASEVPLLFDKVDPGWEGWLTGHKPLEELTRDNIGWTPEAAERLFLDRARYLWARHREHRPEVSNRNAVTDELLTTVNGTPLIHLQHLPG